MVQSLKELEVKETESQKTDSDQKEVDNEKLEEFIQEFEKCKNKKKILLNF